VQEEVQQIWEKVGSVVDSLVVRDETVRAIMGVE
jgi:hypothetical protein